jgi:hypothetical protein
MAATASSTATAVHDSLEHAARQADATARDDAVTASWQVVTGRARRDAPRVRVIDLAILVGAAGGAAATESSIATARCARACRAIPTRIDPTGRTDTTSASRRANTRRATRCANTRRACAARAAGCARTIALAHGAGRTIARRSAGPSRARAIRLVPVAAARSNECQKQQRRTPEPERAHARLFSLT